MIHRTFKPKPRVVTDERAIYHVSVPPARGPRRMADRFDEMIATEAAPSSLYGGDRREDLGWSRTSDIRQRKLSRDLPPALHDRAITQSFKAFRSNPLASRLISMPISFVLANGIAISAEDAEVSKVLLSFWENPYNAWTTSFDERLRDLYVYGEWVFRPFVAPNGFVYITTIRPDAIESIEPDPLDHGKADSVVLRRIETRDEGGKTSYPAKIIRPRLLISADEGGDIVMTEPEGDVFYFGINRTTDTGRGVGMLFPILDFLDLYDDILFSRAEKIMNMSSIFYDLEFTGKSEADIKTFMSRETNLPPAPGTVFAHNESVKMTVVTPNMHADNHVDDTRVVKSHIVSSQGWPGTWVDDPGTAGRAVGAEMAEPSLKYIEILQGQLKSFLSEIFDYVIRKAILAGTLSADVNRTYAISFSRPSVRDYQRVMPALSRLGDFLSSATNKLMDPDEARQIMAAVINQLDLSDTPLSSAIPDELRRQLDDLRRAEVERVTDPPPPPPPLVMPPAPPTKGSQPPAKIPQPQAKKD